MLLDAVPSAGLELVEIPTRLGHANDRHIKTPAGDHRLQRGKDLFVGKVSGSPEEHERVGMDGSH